MKTSISYLSVIDNVDNCLSRLDNTDCDYIHCDIMDNIFVPNQTPNIIDRLRLSTKNKDVHLMVKDVKKYVDEYKALNPEYITFHIEATDEIENLISYIKSLNIKVGLSIKPNTDIEKIMPYLGSIDLVLVMSVEPGFGGQAFIDNSSLKIQRLKQLRDEYHYSYVIEVDGGINDTNVSKCMGADILVVGSFVTKGNDYQEQIYKIVNNA